MTRRDFVEIDLGDVASTKELHAALASGLSFPEWYGHNWDAFWDSITGIVEMPENIRFVRFDKLAATLPDDAAQLKRCLDEMAAQQPASASAIVYA